MQIDRKHRKDKWGRRQRRHIRVRKRVAGTADKPRLMVRKTLKHLYVVVVDDSAPASGRTLLTLSTNRPGAAKNKNHRNVSSAKQLGAEAAAALKEKGIAAVVFDRGGYMYHGCVSALCGAVREGGVQV